MIEFRNDFIHKIPGGLCVAFDIGRVVGSHVFVHAV